MKNGFSLDSLMEPTKGEQALTLPGYLFYLERIEIPAGIETNELNDFAEISLEASSPFPVEQLLWGYLHAEEADSILLYAAHRDCVKRAGFEQINHYAWVLPDFAPLVSTFFPVETEVLVQGADSLSLLHFAKGQNVPTYANVRQLGSEDTLEDTIGELRKEAPKLSEDSARLTLSPSTQSVDENGSATFKFDVTKDTPDTDDANQFTELTPTQDQLWQSDVRSQEFKKNERNARRLGNWIVRLSGWAAILAILLLLGEGLSYGSTVLLDQRKDRIASQQPTVDQITERDELKNKLEQIEQNDLQPISMLRALNNIRPAGIYFTEATIEGQNEAIIDGIASGINEFNNYINQLKQTGQFDILEDKSKRSGAKTSFMVQLNYTPAEEPPAEAASETNETEASTIEEGDNA
ncbi:MAG: hypothetical protein ACPGJU_00980 [Coraliomargarita sp.]